MDIRLGYTLIEVDNRYSYGCSGYIASDLAMNVKNRELSVCSKISY